MLVREIYWNVWVPPILVHVTTTLRKETIRHTFEWDDLLINDKWATHNYGNYPSTFIWSLYLITSSYPLCSTGKTWLGCSYSGCGLLLECISFFKRKIVKIFEITLRLLAKTYTFLWHSINGNIKNYSSLPTLILQFPK